MPLDGMPASRAVGAVQEGAQEWGDSARDALTWDTPPSNSVARADGIRCL